MAYNVEKLSTIDLGRQGENLARTVEIDVHPLLEQWPDAVISLLCKRKHDTNPYVAVTEVRDGILVWPITSVETETAGDGKIELRAVCGEVIAKSMTAVIRVTASLTGSETEAPDAAQGWVDQVLAAGSAAEENAKVAQDAATRAENAASDIVTAVDDAAVSARTAGEQADLAGDHASAAGLSATEAGEDAQRAEQAATSAEESAASAQDSASEADLSRQGADASAQAALDEYNKAAEKAEAAQVSAATAEQSASDAKKSKTAAEQSASAAKTSETNAAKSAEAAARSASDASASKDAAAGSASVARSSEENAAKSAEDAAASAAAAEKSKEGIDEALASAAESAKAAGQSAENSEASAARSEEAAQVALTIIDDENVGKNKTWSSQNLLDRLTVPFEQKGAIVQCYPVEDSPLSVVASIEPVQHFDWASKTAESTQVTTTGKNLCGIGTITVSKYDLVPIGTTLAAGTYGLNKLSEKIKVKTVIDGAYTGTQCSVRFTNTLLHSGLAIDMGTDDQGMFDATFKVLVIVKGTESQHEVYEGDRYTILLPEDYSGGEVNLATGHSMQIWNRIVLDGTEKWMVGWGAEKCIFRLITPGIRQTTASTVLFPGYSNQYKRSTNSTVYQAGEKSDLSICSTFSPAGQTYEHINIRDTRFSTVTEWKDFLVAQYDAGHPVIVYFQMDVPIARSVSPQLIPAIPGVNMITTDATTLTVSGHSDPIRIINDLTERVAALEDAAAGGTT